MPWHYSEVIEVSLEKLKNCRCLYTYEEIKELTDDIKANGLKEPIFIYDNRDDGCYTICNDMHRKSAVTILGWKTIPCIILTMISVVHIIEPQHGPHP